MKPLELLKTAARSAARLRERHFERAGGGGTGISALDAGRRVIEATTQIARHARTGPLPQARGFERVALAAAAGQLRTMAAFMGIDVSRVGSPPTPRTDDPTATAEVHVAERGFESPADRALLRDESEARMLAALGELVGETLALADEVLAETPELGSGSRGRALPIRKR